ncbi:hypothetical protein MPER_03444, partial [Moniliophthora perniciosa FA553]
RFWANKMLGAAGQVYPQHGSWVSPGSMAREIAGLIENPRLSWFAFKVTLRNLQRRDSTINIVSTRYSG